MKRPRWSAIAKLILIPLNAVVMGPLWFMYARWMFVLGMLASGFLVVSAICALVRDGDA